MKKERIAIWIAVLVIITLLAAATHLLTRPEVEEGNLLISTESEDFYLSTDAIEYERVTGVRVNGKGEEIPVEAPGVSLAYILSLKEIESYKYVTVMSDDSYSAVVTAEELENDAEIYLIQEENELRLVVFSDSNSKRSVSNVVQIIVE